MNAEEELIDFLFKQLDNTNAALTKVMRSLTLIPEIADDMVSIHKELKDTMDADAFLFFEGLEATKISHSEDEEVCNKAWDDFRVRNPHLYD